MKPKDRRNDRELFERAVGDLEDMTRAELSKAKAEPHGGRGRRSAPARFRRAARRGDLDPAATLDLHGLDRRQALRRLRAFLAKHGRQACPQVVLVIHGKGERVLAEMVERELDGNPKAAEHYQAPPRLGGGGARLVRLKP